MQNREEISLNDLSEDAILYCFNFLNIQDLNNVVEVSRFWHRLGKDEVVWKLRLKKLYPELYQKYNSAYRVIYQKTGKSFSWREALKNALYKRYRGKTKEEFQDYLTLLACDLEGIKHILRAPNGIRRIFQYDHHGDTIFDFVQKLNANKRQAVLNEIFTALSVRCKKEDGSWDFSDYEVKNFHTDYGIPIKLLMPDDRINPSLLIVFAVLCNQLALLKQWHREHPNNFVFTEYAIAIALRFNYEEIFFALININTLPHPRKMMLSILEDILWIKYNLSFTPHINDYLFRVINPTNQAFAEKWPNRIFLDSSIFSLHHAGNIFLAAILHQQNYLDQHLPDLSTHTFLHADLKLFFYFCLCTGAKYNFNHLLRVFTKKGLTFTNAFEGYQKTWSCAPNFHPLSFIIRDNDLVELNKTLKTNPDDFKLRSFALEACAYYSNIESLRLVLFHCDEFQLRLIDNTIFNRAFEMSKPSLKMQNKMKKALFDAKKKRKIVPVMI